MKTFEVHISDTVLSTAEWAAYIPSSVDNKFPILFRIADGASKLYASPYNGIWLNNVDTNSMLVSTAEKSQAAPNAGISELTLLKAISLAQKPELIKDML